MELQHTFTVPAPVDQAWATLLDVEGIAPCFPGAALTGVDGDTFTGTVKVKLGPVSLQYAGKGRFLERDETAHHVVLEANGSDKRGNGTAGATVHARLESAGENSTRVVVDTDLKVTGRPAQFGRGVLQDVGGKIIDQFATCLAARMSQAPAQQGADAGANTDADADAAAGPLVTAPGATGPVATVPVEAVPAPDGPEPVRDGPGEPAAAAPSAAAAAANGSRPPAPPAAARPPAPQAPAAELDLNAVVLPALARRYGPALLAVFLVLVVVRILVRRRRR